MVQLSAGLPYIKRKKIAQIIFKGFKNIHIQKIRFYDCLVIFFTKKILLNVLNERNYYILSFFLNDKLKTIIIKFR